MNRRIVDSGIFAGTGGGCDMNLRGFQPCDIRGIYGSSLDDEISPALTFRVGRVLSRMVPRDAAIVVSGDGRASTPALLSALVDGLNRACCNLGVGVPTPVASVARHRLGAHTSAVVTASHNPPAYNGIKLQVGPAPITPDQLAAIRDAVAGMHSMFHEPTGPGSGRLQGNPDIRSGMGSACVNGEAIWQAYAGIIRDSFEPVNRVPIRVDCMHGCYAGIAPGLLESMGYRVNAIHNECRGDFGGLVPDPSDDRNLVALQDGLCAGGFAFGAALDGDGDRVRLVDETGQPVDNGTILVLLARYLLDRGVAHPGQYVVYDQKTRLAVIREIRETGLIPVMEKSGHSFIRARMLATGAVLGGEKSGHFFWGAGTPYPVPAGDCGLFALAAVGDLLARAGGRLSELAATVPASPYYTGDIRGLRYAGDRVGLLERVGARLRAAGYPVAMEDGVRVETEDAFVQIRASVTESDGLTVALDSGTRQLLRRLCDDLAGALRDDADDLAGIIQERVDRVLKAGEGRVCVGFGVV